MFLPSDAKYQSEKDTPAYKIFHWPWPVILPNTYMRSIKDMEENGVYSSGEQDIDEELANRSSATTRTIAQLAVLHDSGCSPMLVNPEENAPNIYRIIIAHMSDWAEYMNTEGSRFSNHHPEETVAEVIADIAILENFAKFVYKDGIKPIPQKLRPGSLMEQFSKFGNAISAPTQFAQPHENQSKPKTDLATMDIFADIVQTPTTIARIKKWQV